MTADRDSVLYQSVHVYCVIQQMFDGLSITVLVCWSTLFDIANVWGVWSQSDEFITGNSRDTEETCSGFWWPPL